MMYVNGNPATKKLLKEWVANPNVRVTLFAPGLGKPEENGEEVVGGPHFPQPHTWYAKVKVEHGIVVKVLS